MDRYHSLGTGSGLRFSHHRDFGPQVSTARYGISRRNRCRVGVHHYFQQFSIEVWVGHSG